MKSIFSYSNNLLFSVSLVIFMNLFLFLHLNTQVSYANIRQSDIHLNELIRLTKENTEPEKTMILALNYNTQAGYYLPDYLIYCPFPIIFHDSEIPLSKQNVYISYNHQTNPKTYWISTGFRIKPIPIPAGIETMIVWEEDIAGYYQHQNRPLREIVSDYDDKRIFLLEVKPGEKIDYDYNYWTIK